MHENILAKIYRLESNVYFNACRIFLAERCEQENDAYM